jgi:hypothetical protein
VLTSARIWSSSMPGTDYRWDREGPAGRRRVTPLHPARSEPGHRVGLDSFKAEDRARRTKVGMTAPRAQSECVALPRRRALTSSYTRYRPLPILGI